MAYIKKNVDEIEFYGRKRFSARKKITYIWADGLGVAQSTNYLGLWISQYLIYYTH